MNLKSRSLFIVATLFISGLAFTNASFSIELINYINNFFNTDLDPVFRADGFYAFGLMLICLAVMRICYWDRFSIKDKSRVVLAILVLLSSYLFLLIKTKQNVPVYDEYTAVFEFLCRYDASGTFREKLRLIFEPYFECRTVVPYLFILFISKLSSGVFPFDLIVAINTLTLLLIAIMLYRSALIKDRLILYLPFLLLLVFHSQHILSTFNSFSGLCYHGAVLFTLGAFHSVSKGGRKNDLKTLAFALLAIFTFGHGLLIIPLLFHYKLRRFGLKKAIVFILPLLLAGFFYFYDYHPYQFEKSPFNFFNFVLYIPVFLGSAFQFFYSPILPFILGTGIIVLFTYSTFKSYHLKNPVIYYGIAFIILTAALTAGFRHTSAFDTALRLRYGIFSSLAIFGSLVITLELFPALLKKRFLHSILTIVILYNLATTLFFYPESSMTIRKNKNMLREWSIFQSEIESSAAYPGGLERVIKCSREKGLWKMVW